MNRAQTVESAQGSLSHRSRRANLLAVLVILAAVPLVLLTTPGGTPDLAPSRSREVLEEQTPNVYLALHLEEELEADRTVVWTAAFQAAWDRLADMLGAEGGIPLDRPALPEAVHALNVGRLPPGVVDPGDLTVAGGPATEAMWAALTSLSDQPLPSLSSEPSDQRLVAFARLKASVRYETPFFVAEQPLLFGSRNVAVRAWGLRRNARGGVAGRMRRQAKIFIPKGTPSAEVGREGVVVLTGTGGKRVVLSGRSPKETLGRTWTGVASVLATGSPREFDSVDELIIPRISIVTGRAYEEIAPAGVSGTDARLEFARQDVSLTVDERGADVDAEAVLILGPAMPLVVNYSGPFLVALLTSESELPFVVAWIGSENGLTPWNTALGPPLSEVELRPFAGNWTLDPTASIEATLAGWRRIVLHHHPPTLRRDARDAEGFVTGWAFDLVIEDGKARVDYRRPGDRAKRARTRLAKVGARTVLTLPWGDGGGREAWSVTRGGERLHLYLASRGETLILRRP